MSSEDVAFHYPPDFLEMMISTTVLLVKSKVGLCTFFEGAGLPRSVLKPLREKIDVNRDDVRMVEIARTAIEAANRMAGDGGLNVRRELVRRVSQFVTFEQCWDDKRDAARGKVAEVRQFVDQHDRLTRLLEEQDRTSRSAALEERKRREGEAQRLADRDDIAKRLGSLFSVADAQRRGKALESVLNDLFRLDGVLVKEAFEFRSQVTGGVLEQIDGVIEFESRLYLVEMKWWSEKLGPADVSPHLVKVFNRGQTRGVLIAHPGFTDAAIETVRGGNQHQALFVLGDLEEIVRILQDDVNVREWLKPKIHVAILEKQPFRKYSK